MKKRQILLIVALSIYSLFAQSEIRFKPSLKPFGRYILMVYTDIKQTIDFSGSEKRLQELKERGLQNPLVIMETDTSKFLITTGPLMQNGKYSVIIEDNSSRMSEFTGRKIIYTGNADIKGSIKIDSLLDFRYDDKYTRGAISIQDLLLRRIHIPLSSISPAEADTVIFPATFILTNFSSNVYYTSIYSIESSSEEYTVLKTNEKLSLATSPTDVPVKTEGSGTGSLWYNHRTGIFEKYVTDMKIFIKLLSNSKDLDILMEHKQTILLEEGS